MIIIILSIFNTLQRVNLGDMIARDQFNKYNNIYYYYNNNNNRCKS